MIAGNNIENALPLRQGVFVFGGFATSTLTLLSERILQLLFCCDFCSSFLCAGRACFARSRFAFSIHRLNALLKVLVSSERFDMEPISSFDLLNEEDRPGETIL